MLLELRQQANHLKLSGFSPDRLRSPGDLVARLKPRLSAFGITRLAELTRLDEVGWPVWAAVRPNAHSVSVSQGKGQTAEAAQASAIMEAFEIAVVERVVPERVDSAGRLAADGERYDLLSAMIRRGQPIPALSDALGWIRGHDLVSGEAVWLPAQAVGIDAGDRDRAYWQSSDGVGSGSTMVEAVMHGLLERIERDAEELAQFRSDDEVTDSCIDLGSLSPAVAALARLVAKAGLHLRAFDHTSDLGVPSVFATVSPRPDGAEEGWRHFDLTAGAAARLDFDAAAIAAIGEALQSRLTFISGARDDFQPDTYNRQIAPDILVFPRATPKRVPPRISGEWGKHALDDVLGRLAMAHIGSVIVVPLHEDEDFAVAKIVVPGLELPPGARAVSHGPRLQRAIDRLASETTA